MVRKIFLRRSVSIVLIGLMCGAIMIILQWIGALRWIEHMATRLLKFFYKEEQWD
ncbi:MAG TPA: hypothetical protein ACFYEJ_02835 [Candidatus Wujingus californicus]